MLITCKKLGLLHIMTKLILNDDVPTYLHRNHKNYKTLKQIE